MMSSPSRRKARGAHLSSLGELAGVAQEIEEHPPHLGDVRARRRDAAIYLRDELLPKVAFTMSG